MTIKHVRKWTLALALVVIGAGVALAAVTFDPDTGTGFVGKGDVQLAFGWNNKEIQNNAGAVTFQATSTEVTEVSWECTNTNNEVIQERARTTTTETQGVVSVVTRDNKKQVTGFNLTGYSGTPTESSTTDGPPVNSCPAGPWTLTTPAGEPEVISSTTTVQACYPGSGCRNLQ
jgi:hypothetical protein